MLPSSTVLHQELWLASCMLGDDPQGKIAPYNVSQSLRGKNLAVFEIVNVYCEAVCSVFGSVFGKEATLLFSNGSPPFEILTHPPQARQRLVCTKPEDFSRKDYAFRRYFNEKPSIIPGCPGKKTSA